ncbi:soluble lytic murein transglycosylase-like protein [Symbiobacterium terraclitae]|jgi:soluble lytic murein transglycosylase-like protein|uniref:Soluble lytic murein transglycosylase-like protein n=1 Tax=Symbiobacterium terraclitae TaxID=557451 RepID=A0ABS4JVE5_9FIRM|nr:lytic transglycosylase domain-containing protein [Symbiobacterium terraclitae]MBP2019475.1 soluble lytic murein transglycosylase-like protein [Symbiobacterium terraclitae]
MRKTRRPRRDLVALLAFLVLFSWHGFFGRLEAAAVPEPLPVYAVEPQLPEQELLVANRRQIAVARAQQAAAWTASAAVHDLAGEQLQQVRRSEALRRHQLDRIADLVPPEFQQMVLDLSAEHGVDPRLVAAVGAVESRWNPNTVGSHNDTGLMQILPSTAAWIAGRLGWSEYDLFDPWTNLTMGIWYLKVLHREYGSWEKALAAYNGGPRHAHLGAAHPYVGRVMRVYGGPVVQDPIL